ncbi:acetoin dehydrogenase [Colwellia sp. 39_35_sub15_T18]|nr:acetoin dehydrogenase [Colwellia sp. 39_35_sub15_T18]
MKAAVLFETSKPLQILEGIEIPKLQYGQVLVRIIYSGVCHSQLMEVQGGRGEDKYLPHLLGHEGVGIVEATGEGISKVNVGDTVVLGWIKGQGLDAPGGTYQYQGQKINSGGVTTFSELSVVAENRLVKLPQGMPLKVAVLLGCALPTGAGLVLNELRPEWNCTMAVFGLGGIGLSALIATQLFSPSLLIAVDVEDEKLALAKELGATHVFNSNKCNVVEEIAKITQGGVDYSIEAGGVTKTIEQAFASVKDGGGQCIFASHPADGETIKLEPHAFHRGKSIRGSWGGGAQPDRDIPKLVELYQEKQLPFERLLSQEYSLDNINQALDDLAQRKIVRAVIAIHPELDKQG